MNWFEVDKKGLAKLIERKGKAWILYELIQNAWDEDGVTRVDVTLEPVEGRPFVFLTVQDDAPEGFKDLSHAWKLFAESWKKDEPTRRGRFNLGEKFVLALCDSAIITTTKGSVIFNHDGRHTSKTRTERGTKFTAEIRMTRTELEDVLYQARFLLPPLPTTINGSLLTHPTLVGSFEAVLPTVTSDAEGNLVKQSRRTIVEVIEAGAEAYLYEMGIPVCRLENGERWHFNVLQKVPVSMERDNVSPGYLRTLHVAFLNNFHAKINADDATTDWAREAAANKNCSDMAITTVLERRFGPKRVSFDLADPEANKRATAEGYVVIGGGSMSAGEWSNARRAGAIQSAGRVTPTPKPYSDDPTAPPVEVVKHEDDAALARVVSYCAEVAARLFDAPTDEVIRVRIVRSSNRFAAAYGNRTLDLNLNRLGRKFFVRCMNNEQDAVDQLHRLLIHELAHENESDHLSDNFHRECCYLGAKLTRLAINNVAVLTRGVK